MKLPFLRGVFSLFFWPAYAKRISRQHHSHLNSPEQIDGKAPAEPWPDEQITILHHLDRRSQGPEPERARLDGSEIDVGLAIRHDGHH